MKAPHARSRLISSLLFLATCLTLSGCAEERDYWDWRRDRLAEDVSELEDISGTYRGTLSSKSTDETLGALEITLTPQIRVIPGVNGERADGQPALATRITFEDSTTRFAVTALDGYYDKPAGRIEVTLTIARSGGRSEQMVLSGSVANGALAGNLEITGASELAGRFQVRKNRLESLTQIVEKLKSEGTSQDGPSTRVWRGTTVFGMGEERPVTAVFIDPTVSPEEQFLNRFAPVQVVQFALNYGNSVRLVHDAALWDRRTGKLTGRAQLFRGVSSTEIVTECQASQDSWTCTHQSQGLGTVARTQVLSVIEDPTLPSDQQGEEHPEHRAVLTVERKGSSTVAENETPVLLKATLPARTREQELWELFVPIPERQVTVSLKFGIPGQSDSETVVILFEQALLDLRARTLDGRVVLRQGLGSQFIEVTIRCESFRFPGLDSSEQTLPESRCRYWSSHRAESLNLIFPAN